MLKGQNYNTPGAGSSDQGRSDPEAERHRVNQEADLRQPRDLTLFTIGINTNLRASDLLRIKVGQVRDLKPGDEIELKEKKTGKSRRITLNKSCVQAIQRLLATRSYEDADPLFLGQRGPLTVPVCASAGEGVVPCYKPQRELRQSHSSGRPWAIING